MKYVFKRRPQNIFSFFHATLNSPYLLNLCIFVLQFFRYRRKFGQGGKNKPKKKLKEKTSLTCLFVKYEKLTKIPQNILLTVL